MNSSDFREKVYLVEKSYEVDESGDQIPVNKVVMQLFAKVSNLSSKEYWEAFAVKQELTIKMYCRWNHIFDDIDTRKYSVCWRDKIYNIISVSNIDYRNETCEIRLEVVS